MPLSTKHPKQIWAELSCIVQVLLPGPKGAPLAARGFAFHACLGPAMRQADVLRVCGLTQLLDAALAGFHVTIMTYGQTGSGKTFTMSGREERLEMDDYVDATHFLSAHHATFILCLDDDNVSLCSCCAAVREAALHT